MLSLTIGNDFLGCVAKSLMMMLRSPVWFTPHCFKATSKLFLPMEHTPLLLLTWPRIPVYLL